MMNGYKIKIDDVPQLSLLRDELNRIMKSYEFEPLNQLTINNIQDQMNRIIQCRSNGNGKANEILFDINAKGLRPLNLFTLVCLCRFDEMIPGYLIPKYGDYETYMAYYNMNVAGGKITPKTKSQMRDEKINDILNG